MSPPHTIESIIDECHQLLKNKLNNPNITISCQDYISTLLPLIQYDPHNISYTLYNTHNHHITRKICIDNYLLMQTLEDHSHITEMDKNLVLLNTAIMLSRPIHILFHIHTQSEWMSTLSRFEQIIKQSITETRIINNTHNTNNELVDLYTIIFKLIHDQFTITFNYLNNYSNQIN